MATTSLAFPFGTAAKRSGWLVYHVPDAPIYHLQGQSIGHNISSRIEFYRSRYQFLRKWHSDSYYWTASAIIFLRLVFDFIINLAALIASICLARNIRKKTTVYLQLILWHIKNRLWAS